MLAGPAPWGAPPGAGSPASSRELSVRSLLTELPGRRSGARGSARCRRPGCRRSRPAPAARPPAARARLRKSLGGRSVVLLLRGAVEGEAQPVHRRRIDLGPCGQGRRGGSHPLRLSVDGRSTGPEREAPRIGGLASRAGAPMCRSVRVPGPTPERALAYAAARPACNREHHGANRQGGLEAHEGTDDGDRRGRDLRGPSRTVRPAAGEPVGREAEHVVAACRRGVALIGLDVPGHVGREGTRVPAHEDCLVGCGLRAVHGTAAASPPPCGGASSTLTLSSMRPGRRAR